MFLTTVGCIMIVAFNLRFAQKSEHWFVVLWMMEYSMSCYAGLYCYGLYNLMVCIVEWSELLKYLLAVRKMARMYG